MDNGGGDPTLHDLVIAISKNYGAWQSGCLLLSCFACLALFLFNRKHCLLSFLCGFGVTMIVVPLMLSFGIDGVDLAGTFATNIRYPLSTFAFLGLFIYVPIFYLVTNEKLIGTRSCPPAILLSMVLLGGALYSWSVVREWRTASYGEKVMQEGEWKIVELSRRIERSRTWYTSQFSPAFYATDDIRPRFLLSDDGYDLYASKDAEVVLDNLVAKNVGMVSLVKNRIYPWNATTLYHVLVSCSGIEYFPLLRWDVFLIGKDFSVSTCRQQLVSKVDDENVAY